MYISKFLYRRARYLSPSLLLRSGRKPGWASIEWSMPLCFLESFPRTPFQVTSELHAELAWLGAARLEGMSSLQVFKVSVSAPHSGHPGWLWSQLPRPRLMGPHPQESREPVLASSSWTLRGSSQALPSCGWGEGAKIHPPEGFTIIESLCLIEESPVLCEIRARAPLRFVMGTRGISARVYMVRGGSFMINSYKDSLAGKESILKSRFARVFTHPASLHRGFCLDGSCSSKLGIWWKGRNLKDPIVPQII